MQGRCTAGVAQPTNCAAMNRQLEFRYRANGFNASAVIAIDFCRNAARLARISHSTMKL
jgi:hypothetical protein